MIYDVNDRPPFGKLLLFGTQLMLSVFVASVLIANICGVPVSGALFGAGLATIAYLLVTRYESPMFVSNSGAFVAPVMIALAAGGYPAVAIGGLTTCIVYCVFGYIFSKVPVDHIYYVFPKALIGAVTMVIGITLMGFIGTYTQIGGETNIWGVLIALFTALTIAVISHYAKGVAKMAVARSDGIKTVALSGGCYQNKLLTGLTEKELKENGFNVLLHSMVPPNDGGIALGQALYGMHKINNQDKSLESAGFLPQKVSRTSSAHATVDSASAHTGKASHVSDSLKSHLRGLRLPRQLCSF